ncbi:MAG TPA: DUF192 domain-containing protein [Kofleriaceae bacterium]
MRWILFAALIACSSGSKQPEPKVGDAPSQAATHEPAVAGSKVYFATPKGDVGVDVEVVATEAKIEKGLMYRQHLSPDAGMLFLLGTEKEWTFWMRNTLIPLDMIFVRADMTIAGIVENAEPKTDTLRTVGQSSLYVVEVNGGWTRAHSVTKDEKVRFDKVPNAVQ